jgi:di/tricarboxylate transporter
MFPIAEPHLVLLILGVSMVLFVTDSLRYDLIAVGVVLALTLTGCLDADQALEGFSSEAVILIGAMYIFGHAFNHSGVAGRIGARFLTGSTELELILRLTIVAALLSSVLSNTGVVATLIPVCSSLAQSRRIPIGRLLMPLAFASLLGGLVTVLGTSNNVAINGVLKELGQRPFGMFEFSHLGLILAGVGTLYFLGPGRYLLPRAKVDLSLTERYQVPKFVSEILVEPSSDLINRNVADAEIFARNQVTVLGIVRATGEKTVLAPGPYNRIRADDTLILQGAPEDIVRLSKEMPMKARSSVEMGTTRLYSDDVRLVEAVIAAGSPFVGRTLINSEFRSRTGLNVIAISKQGQVQLQRIQETPLEVGDTLLVQGHDRDLQRARRGRGLLIVDEVDRGTDDSRGNACIAILLAVLAAATFSSVSLAILALCGVGGLLAVRAVRAEDLYRVIDWQVLVLIGGMLALGTAFDQWELSDSLAAWIIGLSENGLSAHTVLIILLVCTTLLTQVLNHVTTAVLMTNVALELATALNVAQRPLLMAVVTGSSLAFLSPVAHQANAMVMGPGGYRYRDYLRAGAPLALITLIVAAWLIPVFWPF